MPRQSKSQTRNKVGAKKMSRTSVGATRKSPARARSSQPAVDTASGYDEAAGYASSGAFARPQASSSRRTRGAKGRTGREGSYPAGGAYGAEIDYARLGSLSSEAPVVTDAAPVAPRSRVTRSRGSKKTKKRE